MRRAAAAAAPITVNVKSIGLDERLSRDKKDKVVIDVHELSALSDHQQACLSLAFNNMNQFDRGNSAGDPATWYAEISTKDVYRAIDQDFNALEWN
jgi:hypothetical protein